MMRVEIVGYREEWPAAFEREKRRLLAAVPSITQLEHIGSTSIAGLAAKPVIDMMAAVESLEEFDRVGGVAQVETLAYRHWDEYLEMAPFRRFFSRDDECGRRTHQIHLIEKGHPWWARHLVFRDYLRADAGARDRYESVKRELARRKWDSTNDYAKAKTEIVITLEEEAFAWVALPETERVRLRGGRM